jgi:phosphatidylserine/phosphatidylglycerophosphate/cardiolipin synthase-like enzyme
MASVSAKKGIMSLRAYRGDAKTLLAFNLDKADAKRLAGFTIQCHPKGKEAYFIHNRLRFKTPSDHAQDPKEPPNSSINAPIHKFRWVHVPGLVHQGIKPFLGEYTYTVTPRFFDENNRLTALDKAISASVKIEVSGFAKKNLELGFTRGYTQSQAFVDHFGKNALIRPKNKELIFETDQVSGINARGEKFTFEDEYEWLGFTAREKIFALLDEVAKNKTLIVDVFAYDLNEPDLIEMLIKLAKQGRLRIILDKAALHHSKAKPKPEDEVEKRIAKAGGKKGVIIRGTFGRYAHNKVFVVSRKGVKKNAPLKVLTGSTNFSVTGLYVNSNHVLIYNDRNVAASYAAVFEQAWTTGVGKAAFQKSEWSTNVISSGKDTPKTEFTFAPHTEKMAKTILQKVADRIKQEGNKGKTSGSVLFAVMQIDKGTSPVYDCLKTLHENQKIFSYGISDSPGGIKLYPVGRKTGVLVTGKPVKTILPPPFNQVPSVGLGHQVHHKFAVCGFNGDDPVVFCGSSNLATGGESLNGDNLLMIRDADVATVFAIEALTLVDHFDFLNRSSSPKSKKSASKTEAAEKAEWFLGTTDKWAQKYFDSRDLHFVDRQLFG